jgi:hypothetical protein
MAGLGCLLQLSTRERLAKIVVQMTDWRWRGRFGEGRIAFYHRCSWQGRFKPLNFVRRAEAVIDTVGASRKISCVRW